MSKFGDVNPSRSSFGSHGGGDGFFSPGEKWCCVKGTKIKAILTFSVTKADGSSEDFFDTDLSLGDVVTVTINATGQGYAWCTGIKCYGNTLWENGTGVGPPLWDGNCDDWVDNMNNFYSQHNDFTKTGSNSGEYTIVDAWRDGCCYNTGNTKWGETTNQSETVTINIGPDDALIQGIYNVLEMLCTQFTGGCVWEDELVMFEVNKVMRSMFKKGGPHTPKPPKKCP